MPSNPRFSERFKPDAVRLVTEEGYSAKRAGEAVGVAHSTIVTWVRRYGEQTP